MAQEIRLAERDNWDRRGIEEMADLEHPFAQRGLELLRTIVKPDYQVFPHENAYNRHDVCIPYDGGQFLIEFEFGTAESRSYWDDKLPRERWVRGCSVVGRKTEEGKHFDLFMKWSATHRSYFAVTYEYIMKHGKYEKRSQEDAYFRRFRTNETYRAIPWSKCVNGDEFSGDDWVHLRKMIKALIVKKRGLNEDKIQDYFN